MSDDLTDRVARIVYDDILQALTDFDVDSEIVRNDPEVGQAARATAEHIVEAITTWNTRTTTPAEAAVELLREIASSGRCDFGKVRAALRALADTTPSDTPDK